MLQGFEKGKLARLLIEAERRFPREDLVTAAVFGIAEYVDPVFAVRMLRAVLGEGFGMPDRPEQVTVQFWDRVVKSENSHWIEPDAIVNIAGDSPVRFIIEAKWQSSFGPQQALKQWQHLQTEEKVQTWHVFPVQNKLAAMAELVDDEAAAKEALGNKEYSIWKRSRCCISWFDISMRLLSEMHKAPATLEDMRFLRWTEGVLSVLKQIGEKAFEGFKHISTLGVDRVNAPIFWNGVTPIHFQWGPPEIFVTVQRPVFFINSALE